MAKKRKWMDVYREMMDDPRNSPDSKWEELLSLSKGFHHFREGNRLARGYCPKWEKKFLKKMIETAENAGQWYSVVWTKLSSMPERLEKFSIAGKDFAGFFLKIIRITLKPLAWYLP